MKDKLKNVITVPHLNFALLAVLIAFLAYTLFAPIVPAVYDEPIIQDVANLQAGRTMTYTLHSCRYVGDGAVTTVTRKLVSTTDKTLQPINLSTDTFTSEAKCQDVKKTLIVPYSTPAGTYQLFITGVYQVIPLRKAITVTATSDSFDLKGSIPAQDIEALIQANIELQEQIRARTETTPSTNKPVEGSSSQQSTGGNTTNNTTTNNTTNNTEVQGEGSKNPGLIPGLLNALGGGGLKLSL